MHGEVKKIIRKLRRKGCTVWMTGGGHFRVKNPVNGREITLACTPRRPSPDRIRNDIRKRLEVIL